ncbi:MAG: DUF485 domain-containing protein [Zoogloeaceae bacterium]|jgi:uncharacterized membrane protein (DUF485 family)|nr:DUF485 domain-containing protein [Zoogloeaceae bacterium]
MKPTPAAQPMTRSLHEEIQASPRYHQLRKTRQAFARPLALLAAMVAFAHMTILVYYRAFLLLPLPGGLTVGMLMGLAFPLFIALLGRALLRHGHACDAQLAALLQELRRLPR